MPFLSKQLSAPFLKLSFYSFMIHKFVVIETLLIGLHDVLTLFWTQITKQTVLVY